MDPSVMQQAMAAMKRMSPEQLAAMQQQVASMPASVIAEQMKAFQRLSPEQQRFAASQAASVDPSTVLSHQAGGGSQELAEAQRLKSEGNNLHGLKQYRPAAEKYEAAKQSLPGVRNVEAQALLKACNLNLASCYLKLGAAAQCVDVCNAILAEEPLNCKALFRRGQAYYDQGRRESAVQDLEQALQNANANDSPIIQSKLQEMKHEAAIHGTPREQGGAGPNTLQHGAEPLLRQDPSEATTAPPLQNESILQSGTGAAQVQTSTAALDMMRNMSPEDLHVLSQSMQRNGAASGPEQQAAALMQDPAMMKIAMKMAESMPPEQMQSLAQSFQGLGMNPTSGSAAQPDIAALAQDPNMMRTMQDMVSSMSPDDLAAMSKQAGMSMSPEQATEMQSKLQNMSPEQMQKMLRVVTILQQGAQFVKKHKFLVLSLMFLVIAMLWKIFS